MLTAQVGCAMKARQEQCQTETEDPGMNVCVPRLVCVALKMFGLYEDIKVFYNKAKREIIHSSMWSFAKRKNEAQQPQKLTIFIVPPAHRYTYMPVYTTKHTHTHTHTHGGNDVK